MIVDVSQEALLAFEFFRRSHKAAQPRRILNQYLAEVAKYWDEKLRTTEEIRQAVLELLHNQVSFSYDECKEALDSCVASGSMKKSGNDNFILDKETTERLRKACESVEETEIHFDRGLSEHVGRRFGTVIGPFAEALLCKSVREVIQGIFYRNAIKLKKLIEGEMDLANLIESDADAEKEFD